ncbi:MAG TPA: hypothetical protein VH207_11795 [Chthoniobacterales bacterium]|jgi:hypothetical protein|nr:hypothetical protein [Chthoniobacterales bacterium]
MEPTERARFNANFTEEKYAALLRAVNETEFWPADFRISETPIFFTPEFTAEITGAARELIARVQTPAFEKHARDAIPAALVVPNENPHPLFVSVDFAICAGEEGTLTPRLIELQGFPTLYSYQLFFWRCLRDAFPDLPKGWQPFFSGYDEHSYLELLRKVIVGEADPENVILLEIEPEKQKTRIDFAYSKSGLGVHPVCLTQIRKRGRQLSYERDGREIRIERIYNRVIFDELLRHPELRPGFDFREELDVHWVGHPNWYFRISKHSLPFLQTGHTSAAFFADEFPPDESLENYVLKPLYSFAGLGVEMEPTRAKLAALDDAHAYILQEKVTYAEFVPTVDGHRSKAEVRMMFLWPEEGDPILVNNLVRMSQGKMMGVDFNKDKTWVGSSIALHEGA